MSTVDHPLGGFEERLLTELRAHVAARPAPTVEVTPRVAMTKRPVCMKLPGSILTGAAAVVATLVAALSLLPGGQTALAQAFPILTQRAERLPVALGRILRTQRLPQISTTPSDHERAYAFQALNGTGYVVVDQQERWICLLVPGLGTGRGNINCQTAERLLADRHAVLRLARRSQGGEDIVELLPRHSAATLISASGVRSIALHQGILTLVTRHPVSVRTTVNGRTTTTTYSA